MSVKNELPTLCVFPMPRCWRGQTGTTPTPSAALGWDIHGVVVSFVGVVSRCLSREPPPAAARSFFLVPHCANIYVLADGQRKKKKPTSPPCNVTAPSFRLCLLHPNKVRFFLGGSRRLPIEGSVWRSARYAARVSSNRRVCVPPPNAHAAPQDSGQKWREPLSLESVFRFVSFLLWRLFFFLFYFRYNFAPLYWAQYCEWMRCDFEGNVKHEICSYFLNTFVLLFCLVWICIHPRCVSTDRQFDYTKPVTFLQDGNKSVM